MVPTPDSFVSCLRRTFSCCFGCLCLGSSIRWSCKCILFYVDNEAVIHILNLRTSPDRNAMHLLRSLLKVAVCLSFIVAAIHVPEKSNGVADALSHFNWRGFRSQAPCAKKSPFLISPQLIAQLSTVI